MAQVSVMLLELLPTVVSTENCPTLSSNNWTTIY
jgi:hypothetical protein